MNQKALLVVSFGTTHNETREKTIDQIEKDLAEAFPDRTLYRGWTSRMIVKRLRECGILIDTLEEAVERMQRDGMTDILVQPTHIMKGAENDRMLAVLADMPKQVQIAAGLPLLAEEEDLRELAKILVEEHLRDGNAALLLMGHGSAKKPEANRIYEDMERAFRAIGCENAFVATVEGTPTLEDAVRKLETSNTRKGPVILAPLMIVAGDHAKNDMAGSEPDSWKNRLTAEGFVVETVLRGLGEYSSVRKMLVKHAGDAVEICTASAGE